MLRKPKLTTQLVSSKSYKTVLYTSRPDEPGELMHHVNFSPRVTGHKHQALYIHRKMYYYVREGVPRFNWGQRPPPTLSFTVYTSNFYIHCVQTYCLKARWGSFSDQTIYESYLKKNFSVKWAYWFHNQSPFEQVRATALKDTTKRERERERNACCLSLMTRFTILSQSNFHSTMKNVIITIFQIRFEFFKLQGLM